MKRLSTGASSARTWRRCSGGSTGLAGRYGARRSTYVFCTAMVGNHGDLVGALCGADEPWLCQEQPRARQSCSIVDTEGRIIGAVDAFRA